MSQPGNTGAATQRSNTDGVSQPGNTNTAAQSGTTDTNTATHLDRTETETQPGSTETRGTGTREETVVPVTVGSKERDDDGSGLVFFDFPSVVGVWFKFPGFPGFSFSCIQTLLTQCNDSSKSDKDDGDDDGDDNDESSSKSEEASTTYLGYELNGKLGRYEDEEPEEGSSVPDKWWSKPDRNNVKNNQVGNCKMSNGVTIPFPQYPGGNDVFLYERAIRAAGNSPLRLIDRWYFWKRKQNAQFCWSMLEGSITSDKYFDGRAIPSRETPEDLVMAPSTDHIFEKSFLADFWRSITPKDGELQAFAEPNPSRQSNGSAATA
ncbi:hypothetical protein QQZ08_002810 [Neonectria magnoliae]|uniref:Uncharacterized protein n=1 Tax=Neonectria magnoliae TaxID=2732573 RepID=A0ABR1IB54_9HYPO